MIRVPTNRQLTAVIFGLTLATICLATALTSSAAAASYDRKFGAKGSAFVKPPVRRTLAAPSCAAGRGHYFAAAKTFPKRRGIFDPIGTVVAKLTSTGKGDRRFGRAGKVNLKGRHEVHALIPAESGSVVVLRRRIEKVQSNYRSLGWQLLKLDRSGKPDRRFGDRGASELPVSNDVHPTQLSVRRLDDGRFAVINRSTNAGELSLITARGKPASGFGSDGTVSESFTYRAIASETGQGLWVSGNSELAPTLQQLTATGNVGRSLVVPSAPNDVVSASNGTYGPAIPMSLTVRRDSTLLLVLKQPLATKYDEGVFWAVALTFDGQVDTRWGRAGFRLLAEYAAIDDSMAVAESLSSGTILVGEDPVQTSRSSRTSIKLFNKLGGDGSQFTLTSDGSAVPAFDVDDAGRYLVTCGMRDGHVQVRRVRL